MVGDFSHAIVTIHNFRSLQDLPQKMHYEAKEYASPPALVALKRCGERV